MEIGAFTFADIALDGGVRPAQRIPELVEEIVLADEVGLDVFGVGEHHHPGFAAPAPAVILAAAAARTSRVRLTSAVTVLSAYDPVRALGTVGGLVAQFAAKNGPGSTYAVGSPQQVIDKLLHHHEVLGHQRTMIQLAVGSVSHRDAMRAIELLGTEVAPVVRAEVSRRNATAAAGAAQ